MEEGLSEEYHITVGEKSINREPKLIYCGFMIKNENVKLFIFCGEEARKRGVEAGKVAKEVAKILGGSGGGDARFGQGGGRSIEKISNAEDTLKGVISDLVSGDSLGME